MSIQNATDEKIQNIKNLKTIEEIKSGIRNIPDFPKKGINFKDITPLLASQKLFNLSITELAKITDGEKIDKVIGIDARGFIFASAVAFKLGVGFVPIRKKGKLPYKTNNITYLLEYGEAQIEMHTDAIHKGENILLIDDLLATGGTAEAAISLINNLGGRVICAAFLIELSFLNGREKIKNAPVKSLIRYD